MITATPLTADTFAPYGDVIALGQGEVRIINEGRCQRHHDLAVLDFSNGAAGISLFQAELRPIPCAITMMERHPDGSQAFLPMQGSDYLVVVAPDDGGKPGALHAFHARSDQGVNYHRNTWHAVLTPISGSGLFAVVDRIGPGANLEEHWFETAVNVATRQS